MYNRLIDRSTSKREVERCLESCLPQVVASLGAREAARHQAAVRFLQESIGDSEQGDKMVRGENNI